MKVTVVGIGKVGSTLAFALSLRRFVTELVLVGRSADRARGEALDLQHAQAFVEAPGQITAGGVPESAGSDVIALCASIPMDPAMDDRLTLGPHNVALFRELVPPLAAASPCAVLVVVSNPVDVLTFATQELSGFPTSRVMGTGTFVDSARFRHLLSTEVGIHPDDLRAYVLGEHGASQFPAMSVALAGGEKIEDNAHRRQLIAATVQAGLEVFRLKGFTNYAIAMAAAAVIEAVALDERHTIPLSVRVDGFLGVSDVCLSLPVVVGRGGVKRILHPELTAAEADQFRRSAEVVRAATRAAMAA
ncbi:lactate/malate dehydrogenase family protein [soil metagenome]